MKLFTLLSCGCFFLLHAQPVEFGVKGGVVLTDGVKYGPDDSKNYTVGPTVEFRLPHRFAIETGFLYKRIGANYQFATGDTRYDSTHRGNSFEIPVVGKYYFRPPSRWTPYLGLGVAMRRSWQHLESKMTGQTEGLIPPGTYRSDSLSPWGAGAVGAAGIKFGAGRVKIAPEFRYTRWSQEYQSIPRNPNQVEFLVGVSF